MIEKEHVLEILRRAEDAVKTDNIALLRELSNQTIHSASIYQDPDSIALAVNIYTLGKIFENERFRYYKYWPIFLKKTIKSISRAQDFLIKNKLVQFRKEIIRTRKNLNLFIPLRELIRDVFRRASINKASKIYEHGISRAETSHLLGISQWELATYSTFSEITDVDLTITKPIKERIKFAEDLFE